MWPLTRKVTAMNKPTPKVIPFSAPCIKRARDAEHVKQWWEFITKELVEPITIPNQYTLSECLYLDKPA